MESTVCLCLRPLVMERLRVLHPGPADQHMAKGGGMGRGVDVAMYWHWGCMPELLCHQQRMWWGNKGGECFVLKF